MKDEYTKAEVVQLLMNTYNNIMKEIDPSKHYKIEGEYVVCYRKTWIGMNTELSRNSFDYVIREAS